MNNIEVFLTGNNGVVVAENCFVLILNGKMYGKFRKTRNNYQILINAFSGKPDAKELIRLQEV